MFLLIINKKKSLFNLLKYFILVEEEQWQGNILIMFLKSLKF